MSKIKSLFAAAAMTLVIAGCARGNGPIENPTPEPSDDDNSTSSPAASNDQDSDGAYSDGTYTALGNYISPAGAEEVQVTITLKDGVVTSAGFVGHATHPTSKMVQAKFAAGYSEQVEGKEIDSISLGVVNGSSLAPKGFMDALAKIKAEAAA